jgi:hypothetical protein
MPVYAQTIVVILALAVAGTVGKGIVSRLRHGTPRYTPITTSAPGSSALGVAPSQPGDWQSDVANALDSSLRDAQSGNITVAEMDADQAASILETARLRLISAAPDFFATTMQRLDRVIESRPDNERLAEHIRLAAIGLAEFRSSMAQPSRTSLATEDQQPTIEEKRIAIGAPRTVTANQDVNPDALGGNYFDATSMPFSAEMLEPPSTRSFIDNIRVEDMTFAGAAQTLDGIHWRNVVFIGTRLRYEGGEVSLQNVRFIRCTFGFTTDERGARLARAIALGQTSLVIE